MTRQTGLAALLAGLATIQMMGADFEPIVSVNGGRVRGALVDQGGAVFKGIPYARPPVGNLRWREPMPVQRWSGVRDATAFGPMCAQASSPLSRNAAEISKEDCLYLNVWTSEWPVRSRRPVMVWIPGGGNFAGTSTLRGTDGASLARHGVVVVSLNHRLGSLGFFAHPKLTRESSHNATRLQRCGGCERILQDSAEMQRMSRFSVSPEVHSM